MPQRILFICHGHPDLVPGGTELFAHNLFRTMRDSGQEAMFLGCVSRLHRDARQTSAFQTIGRSGDELLLHVGGFDRFMLSHTQPAPVVRPLRELLGSYRPDVVHFHHFALIGIEALVLIRRALPEARIVVTLHDYHPICVNDGLMVTSHDSALCDRATPDACHACFPDIAQHRFAARALHLRNMLGLVDRFIAPSQFLKDRFVAWGIAADRIEVIGNAQPHGAEADAPARPRRTFGFFGNVAPHKGILTALAATQRLADVPDAVLQIHGGLHFQDEAFRLAFEAGLARCGDGAVHCGPYKPGDLPARMREVDWVVVPSSWWENAPLVILEAFRHRRPVICSGIGGMAELVADGVNGMHVRPGDIASLARAMRRACDDVGLWDRLRSGIPEVAGMREAADRHAQLYRSLPRGVEALSA